MSETEFKYIAPEEHKSGMVKDKVTSNSMSEAFKYYFSLAKGTSKDKFQYAWDMTHKHGAEVKQKQLKVN